MELPNGSNSGLLRSNRPRGRWVPLMDGARDAWRRSRCGSLATLPRAAFRPPPLTPAPLAERLRSMASISRHRSAVVAGRGLSRWVAERRRATLPIDRVFLASAQPALTCLGSRCLANRLAPGGQPRRVRGRSPSARSVPCGPCRARPIRAADTRVTNFPAGGRIRRGHQRFVEPGTATATRLASFGKLVVGALAHCRLAPILPCSHFSRG